MATGVVVPTVARGDLWTANYNNLYVKGNFDASPTAVVQAKGDLYIATGALSGERLAVGVNGQMLEYRGSANPTKRRWVNSGLAPVGAILMWSGAIAAIPTNWALCNGSGGTPDLRDKFIPGSGTTYSTGDTGGAATANLAHSHTLSVGSDGAHTHTQANTPSGGAHTHTATGSTGVTSDTSSWETAATGTNVAQDDHTHAISGATVATDGSHVHTNPNTDSGGSHSHTLANAGTNSQLGSAHNLLPPYYALAFVMRMA